MSVTVDFGLMERLNDRRVADALERMLPGQGIGDYYINYLKAVRQVLAESPWMLDPPTEEEETR